MSKEAPTPPDIVGRILEVGRDGAFNEVIVDVGRGARIRVSGFSDDMAKAFGRNLFKPITMEFTVHEE